MDGYVFSFKRRERAINLKTEKRVCHLTSAHPRTDTRIFLKECRSLAGNGYSVSLVVADGLGNEYREGVWVYDVGASHGRIDRIWSASQRVFDKAVTLNADIYHLHDPELIPFGLRLKRMGKTVIFQQFPEAS